ncbi:MAG: hypothetical protein F4X54_07985 [Chloroflexi bacterium]|nr:hypothetical protein [Chloroflexota bacterium]MYB84656.1 hypothetical protein [Chloroflexota bacterium]
MSPPKVRAHARYAPRPVPVRDELQHVSMPLVVQVAWSTQRQRWVWFEYLDEIEDLVDQPLHGTVEVGDPAVDGVLTMHEGGTAYGRLSRKRRSQTEVVMSIEELSEYRELLRLVTEPVDWRGSTEGSRCWRAIAKRAIRGYFYEKKTA